MSSSFRILFRLAVFELKHFECANEKGGISGVEKSETITEKWNSDNYELEQREGGESVALERPLLGSAQVGAKGNGGHWQGRAT